MVKKALFQFVVVWYLGQEYTKKASLFVFSVVNGGWSEWSSGPCSTTCGPGFVNKTRTCTNPAPVGEGLDCATNPFGDRLDNVACNVQDCPSKIER